MKAIRIKKTSGLNPAFNKSMQSKSARAGESYDIPPVVQYESGTVAEGPDVWVQCVLPFPTMRPYDTECYDRVVKFLKNPAMKAHLDRLRAMNKPEVLHTLPAGLKAYVSSVCASWEGAPTQDIIDGTLEIQKPE